MRRLWLAVGLWLVPALASADVVTRLPTTDKTVALTFDGCEGVGKPAYLDQRIVAVLEREHLPFTIFASGLFAQRNQNDLRRLAQSPLVEIENHSMTHPQHMERLSAEAVTRQVQDADAAIEAITGHRPRFFRFPAGNYDAKTLAQVEALDHRVVHWRVPSGDPSPGLTADHLTEWVLHSTKPGDILIFHINGRAPATADALPRIIAGLKAKGYGFIRLDEGL